MSVCAEPDTPGDTLKGRMLIAMPSLQDPRFANSVVLMCDHSSDGAMGLIINKPNPEIDLLQLLKQLDIAATAELADRMVHFGGPVEMGRGFVLHSPDYVSPVTTLDICDGVHVTGTLDVLEDIARGMGPARWELMLGYAGWGSGQLEEELAENSWLVCDASAKLVFDVSDPGKKWQAALESIGVAALVLSSEGGRA